MNCLELYWTDSYKTGHKPMLPPGSTLMSSNLTPRSGRLANFPDSMGIIAIGAQKLVRQMKEDWDRNFFSRPIEEIDQFGKDITDMLMLSEPFDVTHFKELHKLGYLPLQFRAITEGTFLPYKVPMTTIVNTHPLSGEVVDWLVNYLETINSCEAWQMPTSATTAFEFKKRGRAGIELTDPECMWFLDFKYHDFSMRGMGGKSAVVNSGLGFAAVSRGSDTLPVIPMARKYYDETDVCINSVIASEHAIMCTLTGFFLQQKDGSWDKIGELEVETFRYLLKKFPSGILSLVSDTWDLWRVLIEYCVILKDEILARDGKLVIRPDSGDPVDIMTGNITAIFKDTDDFEAIGKHFRGRMTGSENYFRIDDKFYKVLIHSGNDFRCTEITPTPQQKGVVELLWDVFGGTITSTGYKKLNSKVGAIYGDSINIDRSDRIDERMIEKGFATTNYVLGVGSYSLQYVTRDTHGFAQKATYVEVNGVGIEIFKDPITDGGDKKSARGLLAVFLDDNGGYVLKDRATWADVNSEENQLKVIFEDGKFYNETTFTAIRGRIDAR